MTPDILSRLRDSGVETFSPAGSTLPINTILEPPCSLKWLTASYRLRVGAFSYCVSGYLFDVEIGRYCSIGESVQMGRGDHPLGWLSTSPTFYLTESFMKLPEAGQNFEQFRDFVPELQGRSPLPGPRTIIIENDVWIGHGAFIRPGVRVCTGAVVAACSVVTKDVPPFAIVAGNPAKVVKFRFSEELRLRVLASLWWTRGPWQFEGLDLSRPEQSIDTIEKRVLSTEAFCPQEINLTHWNKV